METKKPEAKIHLPLAVFIGLCVILLDVIDLIPFAGDITDVPSLGVNFYLYSIGVSGVMFLVAEVLDLFPVLQEFPTRTIAWIATVLFEWLAPAKLEKAVEKTGEMAEGKEGAAAGGVGEAAVVEGAQGAEAAEAGEAAATNAAQEAEGAAGGEVAEESGTAEGRSQDEGSERERGEGGERQQEEGEGGEGEENKEEEEGEGKDEELEEEMETASERSPEEEAAEEDFDLEEAADQADSDEDDEELRENEAHNQAVKSGKVIVMPSPQTTEVPLPSIDEVPKPKKKAA
jgi:hypothetical protein